MNQVINRLAEIICPKVSFEINSEMDNANIRNINNISFMVILYELLSYICVVSGTVKVRNVKLSVLSVFFVIAFCLFSYSYSGRAKRHETISHIKITAITIIAFFLMNVYSICLAYDHYRFGNDIITFYIVNVTFAAFIIIKPYISMLLLSSSFIACYCVLDRIDRASSVNTINFFALACICIVASIAKYHLMLKEQLSKQKVVQLNDALGKAIRYDVLTKLKNRYALIEDSPDYYNKPIYIVMCDCDNFKCINDTYGHITGDKIISAIADVFKRNIEEQYIYRYGGDEFLIVNIGFDDVTFEALKKKIHADLDNIQMDGVKQRITCSFGRVKGVAKNGDDFQQMIKQADRNMYKEKQSKNQYK